MFGIASAAIFLGEALPVWKLLATGLVMMGLCFNTYQAFQNKTNKVAAKNTKDSDPELVSKPRASAEP